MQRCDSRWSPASIGVKATCTSAFGDTERTFNRDACRSYGISRPFTTSRASGPQPLSFRCRRICSLISPHDRTGRSDFDQNGLDHGWNGAPLRTRMLTLRLLKYLYNFSSACVGLLPPMMTYILWQD